MASQSDLPIPEPTDDTARISDKQLQHLHNQLMREKVEPSEGFPPMPIFILFLFATVLFIVCIYFVNNIAAFRWDVYDPNFDPSKGEIRVVATFDPMTTGRRIYAANCQQCHQVDGKGVSGAFPPLAGADWVNETRVRPVAILLSGLVGPIEVEGNTYNGNMPAFGGMLSDRDIGAVLTYVRASFGNLSEEITADHVAAIRAKVGTRSTPWSADELLALSPMPELVLPAPETEVEADRESGSEGESEPESPAGDENGMETAKGFDPPLSLPVTVRGS